MKTIYDVISVEDVKAMSLGDRMKWYEKSVGKVLHPDYPAMIRIDGKAFHTYTGGFDKPWDKHIVGAMEYTLLKLCESVQNVRVGYMQSDEITLMMTCHDTKDKQAWFGGKVDKIVSVAASTASAYFNRYMDINYWHPKVMSAETVGDAPKWVPAVFDARTWNVPMDEANNVFVWRQQDAMRNSVSALAQSHFSHKELHGKSVADMRMMLQNKGVSWSNDVSANLQRGFCAHKVSYEHQGAMRTKWDVHAECPMFSSEKNHVNQFVELSAV